eukprot:gb/GFBE01020071.1/.p1 GENE.gb/GFBE01020071.1/~~gb/GFBE01020071.1/.p1  ORF type:complete len:225 (+),score=27.81 gb/GFBE01020071.1/:1-675(+)
MADAGLNRASTHQIAVATVGLSNGLQSGFAFFSLISCIPGALEIWRAHTDWDAECTTSLAWWLLLQGILTLICGVCGLWVMFCGGVMNMTEEAVEYKIRQNRAQEEGRPFQVDPELERQLNAKGSPEEKKSCPAKLNEALQCPGFILLIFGIYWYSKTTEDNCAESLRSWSFAIILYHALAPCIFCCLVAPCMACCGVGGAAASLARDGAFDDESGSGSGSNSD